jgi:hypothetical protein
MGRAAVAVVAGLFLIGLAVGLLGLDFGRHWDEPKLLGEAAAAAAEGRLLPESYNYPSLSFDLLRLAAAPEALGLRGPAPVTEAWYVGAFRLRARAVFLVLTLASGLILFALGRALGLGDVGSVAAAALLLSSWEVGYHARWIAPDGLVMTLGLLAALAAALSRRGPGASRWRLVSAAAAGVACGAKYTGAVALLPALLAASLDAGPGPAGRARARRLLAALAPLVAVFGATFLATTPGAVLEPVRFLWHVHFEAMHYGSWGHGGYTTAGPLVGARILAGYLAFESLSPFAPAGAAVGLLAAAGAVWLVRSSPSDAAVVLSAPLALGIVLSLQKAMLVRNALLVVPFVALCAGAAAGGLHAALSRRRKGWLVPALLGVVVASDLAWGARAAETIRARGTRDEAGALARWAAERPGAALWVSPRVAARIAGLVPRRGGRDHAAAWAIFESSEVKGPPDADWQLWPANGPHYRLLPTGPFEVNWRRYPSWSGDPRLVLLPLGEFRVSRLGEAVALSPW